jgi:hypothetical protein
MMARKPTAAIQESHVIAALQLQFGRITIILLPPNASPWGGTPILVCRDTLFIGKSWSRV